MRFSVSPAAPDEITAACRLLAARRVGPDRDLAALRYRDLLTSGTFDPGGLFVARAGGLVRGAVLTQPLPGALGLAWPPQAERGRDRAAIEDELVAAACDWLRARGVKVCQSFAAETDRPDMAPLGRHGFQLVTRVTHMRREVGPGGRAGGESLGLRPCAAARDAFTTTLLLTYDGSLDCPELTGDRTPAELVDGFRGNGFLTGEWWYTVEQDGVPVGVVIWEPAAEPGTLELSYLGLVPAARGRGLGDELVRRSLAFARDRDLHTLTLSVDVRNEPALRLYDRHGFQEYDRRDVYLAAWPGPGRS
ncbi:MAG: Acetyltransferase family protein [Gemmataceae bacterium]|nr:Acetyltransferase family protein [Gemmataceae bacterium]